MDENASTQVSPDTPPQRSLALQRCCEARERALQYCHDRRINGYDAEQIVYRAYRNNMPELSGYENIRDFIACTAYGMLLRVIDPMDGAKFLYAAQVAIGVLRYERKLPEKAVAPPPYPPPSSNQEAAQS